MTAILIDDEKNCLDALEADLLEYCPDVKVLAKCDNPIQALELLKILQPKVIFLDIEMPFLNGFELLKRVENISFDIIFVTAYDQFAIKAFQFAATDYLLKPVEPKLLQEAVLKVKKRNQVFDNQQLDNILNNLQWLQQNSNRIAFSTADGAEFVDTNEIIFIEVENEMTVVNLVNNEKIFVSKSLKSLEKILESKGIIRVHLSYLVNTQQIRRYINGQGGELVMNNGRVLPVSRNGKPRLLEFLEKKL